MELINFMAKVGLKEEPIFDGEIHRFDTGMSSSSKSGWYVGHRVGSDLILIAGDWATSQQEYWHSRKRLSSDQKIEMTKRLIEASEKYNKLKEEENECAAIECEKIFREAKELSSSHPYLIKKGIKSISNAKLSLDGDILIPLRDVRGKIWSLQYIKEDGLKMFYKKGKISGNFHLIHSGIITKKIYVCEGVATGQTIHDVSGNSVICAMNVGNIEQVLSSLVQNLKENEFILCADNDRKKPRNAGLDNAVKMKNKFSINVCIPTFDEQDNKSTDFNDLFLKNGPDEVLRQLGLILDTGVKYGEDFLYGSWVRFFQNTKEFKLKKELLSEVVFLDYNNKMGPVDDMVGTLRSIATYYIETEQINCDLYQLQDNLNRFCCDMSPKLFLDVKRWDGVDRISEAIKYVSCKNFTTEELALIFKNFMAKVFARLYTPTVQNQMIILEGEQGLGKDSFIKNLLSGFGQYYCDSAVRDKEEDNYYVMFSRLIINISEFDRASKKNVASLKNMITADSATWRLAYKAQAEEKKFRCSFISSCNLKDVLRDSTGNRRYIFAEINNIDWDYPKFDNDEKLQIVAQAKHLYDSGFKLPKELADKIAKDSADRTPDDPMELAIEYYEDKVNELLNMRPSRTYLTYAEASGIINDVCKNTGIGSRTFLSALKRLKYSTKDKDGGGRFKYYASPTPSLSVIKNPINYAENDADKNLSSNGSTSGN